MIRTAWPSSSLGTPAGATSRRTAGEPLTSFCTELASRRARQLSRLEMPLGQTQWEDLRVTPGKHANLDVRPTSGPSFLGDKAAERDLERLTAELASAQERLYSTGNRALLVILQGLDAAGKDGTIKHVMSGMNPQGCVVTSF